MAILLTVGTAAYSGLRSTGIGPLGSLVAKGVFETTENLILAEFEDHTSDGTLGETVSALFRIDLGQSTSVHLLERSELMQPLMRMNRDPQEPLTHAVALELAQREGVKAVVSGEILPLGQGAVVSARLVAAGSGETLVPLRETARTIDAIPEVVDRLSAQLRERIGESLRSIQGDPPLEEVTTGSLEALRRYVQAEWALDMGDVTRAETLINEAIALDSTFSMAYRKLGVILSNDDREPAEAKAAFTRAYEGRNRLPDRERLLTEAAYHTYVTEKLDSAIAAYEGVLSVYPGDDIAGNNLAVLYEEMDQKEKAAGLYVEAIERGRAPAITYANAAAALFAIGKADSAATILGSFREAYPGQPQVTQYAAAMAAARFDYDAASGFARELLAQEEGSPRWEMWAESELANYALIRGKINEGAERILRAYRHQRDAGTRFTEMAPPVLEAFGMASIQLHFLEDAEGAVHVLDQAMELMNPDSIEPEARGDLDFAVLFSEAGRPDRARERLAAFRADAPADLQREEDWQARRLFAEAAIARAENDGGTALRLYREGRALVPDCELCALMELGETFQAAAMPDSAVAQYEEYLEAPALFRAQTDNFRLHRVLLGLAVSYQALGQRERAVETYRRILDLWSDVDPGLAPRVQRLRQTLSAWEEDTP